MIDKIIPLGNIDPLVFYGVGNENLKVLQKAFTKIKITARGDELMLRGEKEELNIFESKRGEKEELNIFESKLQQLFSNYSQYNTLAPEDILNILSDNVPNKAPKASNVLLYGNNGKPSSTETMENRSILKQEIKRNL